MRIFVYEVNSLEYELNNLCLFDIISINNNNNTLYTVYISIYVQYTL